MGKFIDRFNDYSCIEKNDTSDIAYLSHYTSNVKALSNICSGEFWATDIKDFGDKCEGKLILQRINEIISKINIFSDEQNKQVFNLIGNDEKIEKFISGHRTAVLSMCLNTDSVYLWNNYAKEIVYNTNKQIEIIKEEINELVAEKEAGFDEIIKIEYILDHLMYVGNFYKQEYDSENEYKNEQEYRFVINTAVPQGNYTEIEKMIPVYYYNDINKKHYNILKFDRRAIKTIVCNSRKAKENVEDIISDIPIVLR